MATNLMSVCDKKHRVLITGGLGFIGSNLVRRLSGDPAYELCVVDNMSVGCHDALQDIEYEFFNGDITDSTLMEELVAGCDAVVHLAADTRVLDSIDSPRINFDTNVAGTVNLLEALRKSDCKKIIFASTGGAIGGDVIPPLDENIVARPISPYGASKLACEGYLNAYSACYGINATSLRFSNVYGPLSYHKGSVIATFMRRIQSVGSAITINGDGNQTRDYIYVDDLTRVIEHCITADTEGVYQLGSGVETSILDLIEKLRCVVGAEAMCPVEFAPYIAGEVKRNYSDITKAKMELGYDPVITLEDGLTKTWDWFVSNRQILEKAA